MADRSDTVITAGHCVHEVGKFTSVTKIVVASSITGESGMFMTPFPICGAKRLYSTAGWTSTADEAFDYGAIKLNCKLGDLVGWLGAGDQPSPAGKKGQVAAYDPNTMASTCNLVGSFRNLCVAVGKPMTISGPQLFYDTDVEGGGSGAPVVVSTAPTFQWRSMATEPTTAFRHTTSSITVCSSPNACSRICWRGAKPRFRSLKTRL